MLGTIINLTAKDLKILMIGNSFSICVGRNLPRLVAHEKKHNIDITSAYIGGCPLSLHAKNLSKAEADPSLKPYTINTWTSKDLHKTTKYKGNVNELLKNNKYDIITIQQGSSQSWDYKFYQPHADELIAYIRKYNPQAEIVIQQTWAYRADAPRLKTWKLTQKEMSEKVIKAYNELAESAKLRLIPVGRAVELTRKNPAYQYKVLSEKELAQFVRPNVPSRSGDVVGKHYWKKTKSGIKLIADASHLNEEGEYLQSCVWYSFLFGEDAEKITYEAYLNPASYKILRSAAAQAIKEYK